MRLYKTAQGYCFPATCSLQTHVRELIRASYVEDPPRSIFTVFCVFCTCCRSKYGRVVSLSARVALIFLIAPLGGKHTLLLHKIIGCLRVVPSFPARSNVFVSFPPSAGSLVLVRLCQVSTAV